MLHLVGAADVAYVLDSLGAVCNGCYNFVNRGDIRLCDALVDELHRVVQTLAVCRCDVA